MKGNAGHNIKSNVAKMAFFLFVENSPPLFHHPISIFIGYCARSKSPVELIFCLVIREKEKVE